MTLLLLAIGFGCAPTCEQVCRKTLFDCDDLDTERVAYLACVDQCDRQRTLYEDQWEDQVLTKAFRDHRRCLMQESCDDIADGVCYDERLFVFEDDRTLDDEPFNPNETPLDVEP